MNTTHFSSLELQAREVLARADSSIDWAPARVSVKVVFTAAWVQALSVEQVVAIAAALGVKESEENIQAMLTKFVRAGILRSRIDCRVRLYEINLNVAAIHP